MGWSSSSQEQTQSTNQTTNQVQNQSGESTYNQNQGGYSQLQVQPRSSLEASILGQIGALGGQQANFLTNLMSGQQSPFSLNLGDQEQLDKAYQSAFERFNTEGKDYADYLATTRGLNKSDTPVSQQAMQRYGMGMSDLLSQKANMGLNMGLQGTGLRLQGASTSPSGLMEAFNPMFQERMATGLNRTGFSGSGSSNYMTNGSLYSNTQGTSKTNQSNTPSLMDSIGQGMMLGAGLGSMMGGVMTGNPGLGAMGMGKASSSGMGSGAAANKTMGNLGYWM